MKNYYVLSNGRVRREHNTVTIENASGEKKPIPVEDVDSLYLFGEVDLNTRFLNFLSQKKIPLHVFNYYGFYSGSYYPREYLHSGYLLVHQVRHYCEDARRMALAREIVRGAAHSLLRNIAYYCNRASGNEGEERELEGEIGAEPLPQTGVPQDADVEAAVDSTPDLVGLENDFDPQDPFAPVALYEDAVQNAPTSPAERPATILDFRETLTSLAALIDAQTAVNNLRGIEGKMRERYYQAWRHILHEDWTFDRRVRRPPDNEINALISFGNSVLYTVCLSEIYRTQLTPTISYLHEPGARRFSLALDLSEIFKPLLVDRAIFRLINTGQLRPEHFDRTLSGCYLVEPGKKLFLSALEERMAATIKHRRLGRHVSYRHLIRLECYKLIRHLTEVEPYHAFRAWW